MDQLAPGRTTLRTAASPCARAIGFGPAGTWPMWWRSVALAMPDNWDFDAVVLPARAARLEEPPLNSIAGQTADVMRWLGPLASTSTVPLHLVGVCSGALLAHSAALELTATLEHDVVLHLVEPASPASGGTLSQLAPAEFLHEMVAQGFLPAALTESAEAAELFLPALRGDIMAAEGCPALAPWTGRLPVSFYVTPGSESLTEAWPAGGGRRVIGLSGTDAELVQDPGGLLAQRLVEELEGSVVKE